MGATQLLNESVQAELHGEVLTIWLNTPKRSVNVLDESMLQGIAKAIDWAEQQLASENVACVIFRSQKEDCFFVGADVASMAELNSSEEAMKVLAFGQDLFQRIEDLPIPTLAAINGTCLGGGLELALACDHRVALQSPHVRFALPEIKLGLIPGWGGTQRLPRIVGLQAALKMILTGKALTADEALDAFLLDRSLPLEYWELFFEPERIRRFCEDQADATAQVKACQSWRVRLKAWALDKTRLGRWAVLRIANRKIASKSKQYPALAKAIQVIRAGLRLSLIHI